MANKNGKKEQPKKNTSNSKTDKKKEIKKVSDKNTKKTKKEITKVPPEEQTVEAKAELETSVETSENEIPNPIVEEQTVEPEVEIETPVEILETEIPNPVVEEEPVEPKVEIETSVETSETEIPNPVVEEEPVSVETLENEKYCPKCGTKIIGKFCANCGANVETIVSSKEVEIIPSPTIEEQTSVVNPVTVPQSPVLSSIDTSSPIPLDDSSITTPPVNPMGVPGIMPIPNAGMSHNVMNYQSMNSANLSNNQKRSNKLVVIVIAVLIVLIAVFLIYFLVIKKNDNKVEDKNSNVEINTNSNSNLPTNSNDQKEEEDPNTTKLSCTLKEDNFQEGIDSKSVIIYVFKDDVLIKTINEESLEFSPDALKYYGYYEGALKEMLEEESEKFDNTTLEMKKTDNVITSIYTVDLTADPSNPKNNLDELGYTYSQAKKELEAEGYICK